jgi:hypothetical protein
LAKFPISVNKILVLATSLKVHPTPYNAAFKFFITWFAWPSISYDYIFPLYGFIGIWPDTKIVLPIIVTGLYGPIAAGKPFGKTLFIVYIPFLIIIIIRLNNI